MRPSFSLFSFGLLAWIGLSIVAVSLTACQSSSSKSSQPPNAQADSVALHLALTPTLDCLPFYYVSDYGLADTLGLHLVLRTFQSQMDADTALLGNNFDGGVGDTHRQTHYGRAAHRLVPQLLLPTQWRLITHADLRMPTLAKLNERTIAVARFATDEALLFRLTDSLRLSREKIYRPQINSFSTRLSMLENKQIDAALLPEPFATTAQQWGHRVSYRCANESGQRPFYLKKLSAAQEQKKQQYTLLQKAYNQAVRAINAGSPKTDSLLLKRYQLPPDVVKAIKLPLYKEMQ